MSAVRTLTFTGKHRCARRSRRSRSLLSPVMANDVADCPTLSVDDFPELPAIGLRRTTPSPTSAKPLADATNGPTGSETAATENGREWKEVKSRKAKSRQHKQSLAIEINNGRKGSRRGPEEPKRPSDPATEELEFQFDEDLNEQQMVSASENRTR